MGANAVKLGLMPPLTGLAGMYGAEITRAGQIACDEVNENGGVLGRPLELVVEDDGSLPESAVAAANKLVNQHCVAIIGNLLSNSRIAVAYRVAEPRRIPYLNFSFYEGSILSRYFFHFAALPNQQIDMMIPSMRDKFGSKMFFAGNNYEWPRGSIDAAKRVLQQAGGRAVGEEYYPIGASDGDIERLLDHLEESDADVFVPYFAGADQVRLLTRFTERGLKKRMAVVMGHYDEIMASNLPPEVREGFYSSNTYFMTLDTPANRNYLSRLSALPGMSGIWPKGDGILTNFGEGAYLCVKAFANAANRAGSLDAEALVEALETVGVSGPQGAVQMDAATHHAKVNTYLSRCQADGSFSIVEQFGAIAPVLPERYRHLRISQQHGLDEDIRFQARMLDQMAEAIFMVRASDGAIIYCNSGVGRMFGYASGELFEKHFSVILDPTDSTPEEVAAVIGAIVLKKGVWEGETRNKTREGSNIWCAVSASAFTHPQYGEVWMMSNRDISRRKQLEDDLKEAALRYRAVMETANDAIICMSPDGIIYLWNHKAEELFGYTAGEAIGQKVHQLIAPEQYRGKEEEGLRQFARSGTGPVVGKTLELSGLRKDGVEFPVELSISPMNIHGEWHATGIIRDITARKQAEARIQKLSRLYATLSQTNHAIVRSKNRAELFANICASSVAHGKFVLAWVGLTDEATRTVKPVCHYGAENDYLTDIVISVDDVPEGRGPTGAAIRENRVSYVNDYAVDERTLPWRDAALQRGFHGAAGLPLRFRDKVIGALTLYAGEPDFFDPDQLSLLEEMAEDISFALDGFEREALRQQADEAIRAASQYSRSLIEASLDPLVTISAEGKITDVNAATEQVTGADRVSLIGSDFADYFTDQEKARAGYQQVFSQGFVTDYPLAIRHVSGKITDVLYNASVYRDGKGIVLGVFAAARDITARKQAEAMLAGQLDELRRWHEATLGREMRTLELKHEVNRLLAQVGQPPRYPSAEPGGGGQADV